MTWRNASVAHINKKIFILVLDVRDFKVGGFQSPWWGSRWWSCSPHSEQEAESVWTTRKKKDISIKSTATTHFLNSALTPNVLFSYELISGFIQRSHEQNSSPGLYLSSSALEIQHLIHVFGGPWYSNCDSHKTNEKLSYCQGLEFL